METLTRVAYWHLKTTYVGLQKCLQQEWASRNRVTPGIGMSFHVVDYALQEIFLLSLFHGSTAQITGGTITSLPKK